MPKMKTKRALAKRVKKTGTGKLKRGHAYTSHLAPRKTHKQKKHLAKQTYVHPSDYKRIKSRINTQSQWIKRMIMAFSDIFRNFFQTNTASTSDDAGKIFIHKLTA